MFTSAVENSSDDSSCLDQAGQASQPNNAGDGTLFLVHQGIVIMPNGRVTRLRARNTACMIHLDVAKGKPAVPQRK